ncbi:short-chain dehydrogenase/reductase family 9C member 7-like [Mizuhopecten yessoensis]|uniref:17-beta-hydroxysteroid dehydrogenase type 6 n=1 Tax=Mizuhopecten yessoensis TaxID=6573 RepID=A0A210QHV9_MIZYE|nr:short-chain dehydrogenase/reductase family 9C member 7-like [Mizuhopecten yessoensis]OWF48181.1 17-beta-hydroxysteroid dehydrogenase type 6 [Mizuhopecten yessoensis]
MFGTILVTLTCFAICLVLYVFNTYRRNLRIPEWNQHYVLVTGCDSGFGRLLAKQLDKAGVHVFAGCLNKKAELGLKQKCSKRLKPVSLDVTSGKSIAEAVEYITNTIPQGQGLGGVVNNAGIFPISAPLEWLTKEDYDRTFAVNLHGVISVTTACLPLLRAGSGRVVTLSSDAALFAWPGGCAYNISKWGVEAFTDTFRREFYNTDMSAHLVQPGAFQTSIVVPQIMAKQFRDRFVSLPEYISKHYGSTFFNHWRQNILNLPDIQDTDLSKVTDAITHALFAMYPHARYRVGNDCRFMWWPLSMAPVWFSDWLYSLPRTDLK